MSKFNELRDTIANQKFKANKAATTGMMVDRENERLKNMLMNSLDEILEAIDYAISADTKIERLSAEVESADRELQEKDEEIKELKETKGGKRRDVK